MGAADCSSIPVKLAIPRKITSQDMAANTKPEVRRLQRKVDVFRPFELQDCEMSRARDGEQIQNAALAASERASSRRLALRSVVSATRVV